MKNFPFLLLIAVLCLGCSAIDKFRSGVAPGTNTLPASSNSGSSSNSDQAPNPSTCNNKYNPVADGAVKNYKMIGGGKDTTITQKHTNGSAEFIEETKVGGTTVRHRWECTAQGLIAATPGSMMSSTAGQTEPKHISGVTLPIESEIQIGKEWTAVYQANGKTAAGNISSDVTIKNKIVSMDDEVKVPGGTFKAVKVEMIIDVSMKMNGGTVPVPQIRSHVWFAPGIGMVKNMVAEGSLGGGSGMEYSGEN